MLHAQPHSHSRIDPLTLGLILAIIAGTITLYGYYASPSFVPDFYTLLGNAFLSGHTYLGIAPSPELLALPDPYNPAARAGARVLWDASLYHNRYYIYFGPVPALVPWIPVKWLTGVELSNASLTFFFASTGTAYLVLLVALIAIRQALVTRWGLVFAAISLCLGTWLPFLVRRPAFYEVAISGAYCFTTAGLLCLWMACEGRRALNRYWAMLASLCFGLAVGCRVTHGLNGVMLITAWAMMQRKQDLKKRASLLNVACLFGPWLLCLIGLAAYNYARFDSAFETGLHYQLTLIDEHAPDFSVIHLRLKNIGDNIYFYFLRPLPWKTPLAFPFLYPAWQGGREPVYGLWVNSPFSLWFLALLYHWRTIGRWRPETQATIIGAMLFSGGVFAFFSLFFYSTLRYAIDFTPWMMLSASLYYLYLVGTSATKRRYWLLLGTGGIFALYGAFTGVMSGYCGYDACPP